jgi:hypothetical protein
MLTLLPRNLTRLTALRSLDLSFCTWRADAGLSLLRGGVLSQLHSLDLSGTQVALICSRARSPRQLILSSFLF